MAPTREELHAARVARHGADNQAKFAAARIGIAGLGGLGSAIAFHLARLGVGTLVLADRDLVDVTNLHRQQYRLAHIGMAKADALSGELAEIDPYLNIEAHQVELDAENAARLFNGCDIVCEAFDDADQKALLVETLLAELPDTIVVSGSGMAGFGSANSIRTTRPLERLYVCGDGTSGIEQEGSLTSARVGACAAHQANMVARIILGEVEP